MQVLLEILALPFYDSPDHSMWFLRKNNQGDCRVNTDDPRTDAASQTRRLRRLLEASRLLNSTLELRELTEIVLRIIQDELPVERCTLFVLDPHRNVLRSLLAQGVEELEIVLAMGEGLAGTVAATGTPLDVPDAYADARFHPGFDRRLNFRTRMPCRSHYSIAKTLSWLSCNC